MRALAMTAALAVTLTGTGCFVAPCADQTMTIDWSFQDINGVAGRSCAQVGVAYVDVYVDGARVVDAAPCTDYGVALYNVPTGNRQVVVEGLDASLVIVNRDQLTVSVDGCGNTHVAAVPGEGMLRLDYHFTPTDSCAANYMWYSLTDLVANDVISAVQGNANPTLFTCGPFVQFPVPFGSYRLDWIQAVSYSGGLGRYVAIDQLCSATRFSVFSGGNTDVRVDLPRATFDCGVGAAP